jgi:hypothetical protein
MCPFKERWMKKDVMELIIKVVIEVLCLIKDFFMRKNNGRSNNDEHKGDPKT